MVEVEGGEVGGDGGTYVAAITAQVCQGSRAQEWRPRVMQDASRVCQHAGRAGGLCGLVDVTSRVLFLPLGASVLKPNLDLRLGQVECQRQVESLTHAQVPSVFELVLQRHQLLIGEGCPGPSGLAAARSSPWAASPLAVAPRPAVFVLGAALTVAFVSRVGTHCEENKGHQSARHTGLLTSSCLDGAAGLVQPLKH